MVGKREKDGETLTLACPVSERASDQRLEAILIAQGRRSLQRRRNCFLSAILRYRVALGA